MRKWRPIASTPVPRNLSTISSGLSLLLLPFAVALWVQSYAIGGQVGYRNVTAGGSVVRTSLASFAGRLALSRSGWDGGDAAERSGWFAERRHPRPGYAVDGFAGFEHREVTGPGRWLWEVRIPMWAVAAALAIPPAWRLQKRLRRRRDPSGSVCRRCGYDLRATPYRCPECGATATPQAPASPTPEKIEMPHGSRP